MFLHGQTIIESKEINIVADVEISWYYSTNSGNYFTPPSSELTDENISIYIIEVLNENGNIEITQENETELKRSGIYAGVGLKARQPNTCRIVE